MHAATARGARVHRRPFSRHAHAGFSPTPTSLKSQHHVESCLLSCNHDTMIVVTRGSHCQIVHCKTMNNKIWLLVAIIPCLISLKWIMFGYHIVSYWSEILKCVKLNSECWMLDGTQTHGQWHLFLRVTELYKGEANGPDIRLSLHIGCALQGESRRQLCSSYAS